MKLFAGTGQASGGRRRGRGGRRQRAPVDDDQSDTAPATVALAGPVIAVSDGDATPPGADVAMSAVLSQNVFVMEYGLRPKFVSARSLSLRV